MKFEELKPVLEQTPELLGEIVSSFKDPITKTLADAGMIIRSREDDAAYLDNQIKTLLPAKVGQEFGNALRGIDEQIKAIVGIDKNSGEKTTDYVKRAVDAIKSQGVDPTAKQRITDLEALLDKTGKEKETEVSRLQKALFQKEVDFQMNGFLESANLSIPAHLKTDEEKTQYLSLQRQSLRTMFGQSFTAKEGENGKVVFYDGDKALLNTKDGSPLTASELFKERFGSFIAPATQGKAGTGQGQNGQIAGQGANGFSTAEEIHGYLKDKGVALGSKAYLDEFKQLAKSSNVAV